MFPKVDFDSVQDVSEFVRSKYLGLYPGADDAWLKKVFIDVEALFTGKTPSFAAIDLKYHNLRHTLMATVCMSLLLEGHIGSEGGGDLRSRDFELAIAAVLLHDSGYLKLKNDVNGTGAKYTYCHILRSCAFAASYLPEVGVTDVEVDSVIAAINCTGPNSDITRLRFKDSVSKVVGCALATADYLGQLSDPDYPGKLGYLYAEFHESDEFANIPLARRAFKSEAELISRTPGFWLRFVKPKLEHDFQSSFKLLERPLGSGSNAYMDAVDRNFAIIDGRTSASG
ncbi:MAG TPA: hypothetical protein VFE25_15250 [Opitutaceae bacterium]|nr:hypothetical protein [Opitutaceae bacterium]